MELNSLLERFFGKYNERQDKPAIFFSPGRVNLIGEHTDYNAGYVFPCALNYGTYLVIRKRKDNILNFSTLNFNEDAVAEIKGLFTNNGKKWINYPLGVINEFMKKDVRVSGLDMLFYGDVPNGAGLSSSASIEMVTAIALNEFFNAGLNTLEMVRMSQRAENQFVGMNCGIMDQFAVGYGKKDHAIFLNCDTLDFENVPLVLKDHLLIITNTNKRRGLTDSKYNERRGECERAVEMLQPYRKIRNLSEISTAELNALDEFITDPVVRKRAKHVITENGRVLEAVKVLKSNNIAEFGELMNQSHDSLKEDYDVTGKELDTLVYEGRKLKGVIGTRMTGAGFGGCTVSIVKKEDAPDFIEKLAKSYTQKTSLVPDFYLPEVGDGARRL